MRGRGTTGRGRRSRRARRGLPSAVDDADDSERAAVDEVGVDHRGPYAVVAEQHLNRPDVGCAQGVGQVDLAASSRELLRVAPRHGIERGAQLIARSRRVHGRPSVLSSSTAYQDVPSIELDVVDADHQRFEEAEAASLQELADEAKGRDEVRAQGEAVLPREDRGEVLGPAGAFGRFEPRHLQVEDPLVAEEARAGRLVLRRRRGAARDRNRVKEGRDLFRAHGSCVLAAVEVNELPGPVDVRLFRARGVMQASDGRTYGLGEGHAEGPGCARAARRARIDTSRSGAGARCVDRRISRPSSGRTGRGAVGTNLAPRGTWYVRGLAAGIRGHAAAAYLRRCVDRLRKAATYPREYGDRPRGDATYPQEYGDRLRRLAAYMQDYGDRPCPTADCDFRRIKKTRCVMPTEAEEDARPQPSVLVRRRRLCSPHYVELHRGLRWRSQRG
jgi:hypothetical protein